jgi:hypothetical protein
MGNVRERTRRLVLSPTKHLFQYSIKCGRLVVSKVIDWSWVAANEFSFELNTKCTGPYRALPFRWRSLLQAAVMATQYLGYILVRLENTDQKLILCDGDGHHIHTEIFRVEEASGANIDFSEAVLEKVGCIPVWLKGQLFESIQDHEMRIARGGAV